MVSILHQISLTPTTLTFATQLLGTTSPAQAVTLINHGTATLSITSIGFKGVNPGDFAQTNTCGSSVAPGASCTISVTFKPTGINTRSTSLSITDDAPGSPRTVSLRATGTVVKLGIPSFCFELCPWSVTLTNVGKITLHITGITIINEDFSQTNNCGSSLAAGQAALSA